MTTNDIRVTATAQIQNTTPSAGGLFPVGLDANFNYKFDGSQDITLYSPGNKAPGNKGPVNFGSSSCGKGCFDWNELDTGFGGTVTPGQVGAGVTGCCNGLANSPFQNRIDRAKAMDPGGGTWNNHSVGNPLQVVVATGTWAGNGNNATFTVSGFINFFIDPSSSACSVTGVVMPGVGSTKGANGTVCTPIAGNNPNGLCAVVLIK